MITPHEFKHKSEDTLRDYSNPVKKSVQFATWIGEGTKESAEARSIHIKEALRRKTEMLYEEEEKGSSNSTNEGSENFKSTITRSSTKVS